MNVVNKKKVILGVVLLLLLVSIPLTLSLVYKKQETRSRAAGSTTLSFSPDSSTSSPIQAKVGDPIDLDLYADPSTDQVTFIKYHITFDPTKIQLISTTPVEINTASTNLTNVEGPVTTNNSLAQSVSIGADPTKVLTNKTKIVTIHFKAVGSTNGSTTTIVFNNDSQALSAANNTEASQNVLSTTIPAVISISSQGSPSVSPSQAPSGSPSPSSGPSPTQIPIPTVTGTAINFTLLLHGVGSAGDNPNPTGNSLSNKNPLHQERNMQVQVYDSSNKLAANVTGTLIYKQDDGTFVGAVSLPQSVQSGSYSVKVQTDGYLRRLLPSIQQITSGQETQTQPTQMVAGDTNGDNVLNVLDYNGLLDCGYGQIDPLPMSDSASIFQTHNCQVHTPVANIDTNDDGIIDSTDYNLFLRELSVQTGD